MSKVYCGLGTNIGDRIRYLSEAVSKLNSHPNCAVVNFSSVYETLPMGDSEQNNYLNAVVEVETDLNVYEFHSLIKSIEVEIGRNKTYRWGPREIDIDLLFFDDLTIETSELTIPHKGIVERDFVLVPLLEIAPEISMPKTEVKLKEFNISLTNHYILNKVLENLSEVT